MVQMTQQSSFGGGGGGGGGRGWGIPRVFPFVVGYIWKTGMTQSQMTCHTYYQPVWPLNENSLDKYAKGIIILLLPSH